MEYVQNSEWIFQAYGRFPDSSQPARGIGTRPQSAMLSANSFEFDDGSLIDGVDEANLMTFTFIRFYETAFKKIGNKGFYAGLGLHLDFFRKINDQLLDLDTVPAQITPYYAYNVKNGFSQEESTLVGISLNGLMDTRDNINNPYAGGYALASFKVNPDFLGSDISSSSLWLEYRDYFNFTEDNHNILALWTFGNFTLTGDLPYMNLPAIGWDQYARSGTPYTQGRFRGIHMMYVGAEYRRHLYVSNKKTRICWEWCYLLTPPRQVENPTTSSCLSISIPVMGWDYG